MNTFHTSVIQAVSYADHEGTSCYGRALSWLSFRVASIQKYNKPHESISVSNMPVAAHSTFKALQRLVQTYFGLASQENHYVAEDLWVGGRKYDGEEQYYLIKPRKTDQSQSPALETRGTISRR
eukprot:comp11786_c0_seq1/m.6389 comp11786_c0_seq1/g.6389  ORF comp11786_c0_seq1/g.6389 comp11786_c0_seq1/m.6389 type:complete len:124 (-) comp11786_c0_seq1:493-864(-)